MKKWIALLLSALLLFSAADATIALAEDYEPVTLRVWGGDLLNNTAFYDLMKAQYPWMDYEVVEADSVKIMSMIATDDAPDIWILSAFHMGCMYAARGLYEPLDEYIANSAVFSQYTFNPVQNLFRFDAETGTLGEGPVYGIVKDWSVDTQLFINKKVFADAGLEIPDPTAYYTWDEVREWAKAIVKYDEDGNQVRWGFGTTNNKSQMLTFMLSQLGVSMYSDDLTAGNINTPEMRQCLEYWADMYESGAAIGITSPGDWGGDSFASDNVGILMLGHWFQASLKQYEASKDRLDDFVLIQSPVFDKENPTSACLAGVGGSIYSGSKHKDEAFQLLELYLGGEFAEERTKLGWGNPSIIEHMQYMPNETDFEKQTYASNAQAISTMVSLITNPYITSEGVEATFSKYFNEYLYDRMTMDEVLEGMQKEYDIMIEEGRDIILN